jgi:hypothetical protein
VFDKRYEDIIEPAVSDAGLKPYRVDRDPAVNIPIEEGSSPNERNNQYGFLSLRRPSMVGSTGQTHLKIVPGYSGITILFIAMALAVAFIFGLAVNNKAGNEMISR